MRRCLYILLLCALIVGCSSIDCPMNSSVRTFYELHNSDGTILQIGEYLSVVSKRFDGTDTTLFSGPDTLLLNKATGISKFSLPMSQSHPEDILIFRYTDLTGEKVYAIDTVWIKKEDIPHFESVDCNASFFHQLTDVRHTHHFIDSLVIKERSVDYDKTKVHFYLYPDTVR